jgi:hypothetical protein
MTQPITLGLRVTRTQYWLAAVAAQLDSVAAQVDAVSAQLSALDAVTLPGSGNLTDPVVSQLLAALKELSGLVSDTTRSLRSRQPLITQSVAKANTLIARIEARK